MTFIRTIPERFHGALSIWTDILAEATSDGVPRDPAAASAMLATWPADDFIALDERLRRATSWWHMSGDVPSPGGRGDEDPTHCQAAAFVVACHADGFVRERALLALADLPGRLTLAAALLRCDDWVEPVRRAARDALSGMLPRASDGDVFGVLELVLDLRARKRFGEMASAIVDVELESPRQRDARWRALSDARVSVRAEALAIVLRADRDRRDDALALAARDAHPAIARTALAHAAQVDDALARTIVDRTLRHRLGSVRAAALRVAIDQRGDDVVPLVRDALFDPTPAVRNAAAHMLRSRDIDPVEIWRTSVGDMDDGRARIALAALAEYATAADAPMLRAWLQRVGPRSRMHVLRALARSGPASRPDLVAALSDPAPRVVDVALRLLEALAEPLYRHDVERALEVSVTPGAAARLLRAAASRLAKWEGLELLLARGVEADEPSWLAIVRALDVWRELDLRRFTPLPDAMRESLVVRIDRLRGHSAYSGWSSIRAAVDGAA